MKLVFVIFVINVVFITINSEKVDSEEEYFIDDEDKFSDEDKLSEEDVNYNSDEDTNSESETVADKDKHLQTYLGLDRGFVSNKITKNWCPEDCKKEGQKYENPNLSSYCVCERNRTNNKLNTVHYYCAKHEIYNSTVHGCHKLKGNGYATCVIRNKTCPSNKTGVFKHPNKDLYKNYIVCLSDMVIVAQCKYMAYYNDIEKRCVRHSDKETILTYSDCEEAPTIDCREPGVIPVEEYFQNNSAKISDNCKNCYYLCNDRDLYSYDLAVHCFPDNDAKQKDTTTWDYTIRYSNQTTIDYKYETSATAGIAAKPLVIEPTNAEPTGLSTTIILSMKQTTTAIETDESKSSLKATKVLKTTTDVKEKTEPATAETEAGPFYEKTSTMASISSQQPTKLARTPALTTEEKIKITTHEQQTVTEEALGGTATTIIRPSATETTKTKTEVQSTEEGKSSTLSIQSTGHVISENATIIIASETSSSIPETLTKEVRKTTVEYPQITGQSTTSTLSTKQKTTAAETDKSETSPEDSTDFVETSFATEPAEAETKDDSTHEEKSTTLSKISVKPTKLTRTPIITTKDWEKTNITTGMEQTATEEALGGTATTRIRPSATETTKTKTEVQSTEEEKSSTSSILSTGLVILENATTIIASTKGEGETTPHTESTVFVGLPGVTHTTDTELTPIATGSGRTETIDKGGHENETRSSSPETLTKEVSKTTVEYSHTTGQSTTSTLSTKQKTTAAETDKSETSPEDSTDFVETSYATEPAEAETKVGATHEEISTTVSKTSLKPTKLTRTPTITTKDWEKTNITTGMEQTATEEALGGTATTRIRPSATETTKTKTEVQSTEEEKSSTTSILSTGQVILENTTTIIASTKGEGETTPHTESTVFVGLPGVTHTTDTELTPIATGSGRTETIDKGGHENETSSSSPETLTKEVRKTTVEYSHTTGQSTTSTLSTKQKTTAAETDKSETSPEDSTDFVETSFATEPAEAETKVGSTHEERSTTVSKTSLKPTKLTRTPTITTKDWEKTNITTGMEQTATEEALGGTATTRIRPSATETTKTKTEVQSTEEEKSSTTSILSTGQVILENATTIIASTKGEGETTTHTESTVFVGLPGVTHTTDTELTPIATGSGRTETIDKGGHENETSSSIPETLTKEVRKTTVEYSHTTGQSTTSTLSTKQKTTAAEIDKSETSPEDSTDFVETSFATEPAEAETKDDSTQEEKSTTVSKTSLKPTKPTRIPTITTKDWEKTNITTRMEQTATEEALGGTATTRIRPSATETTKTKTEVQSTEEEKSSTSSILSTGLVILENATTIIASTKGEGETTPHTESTVFVGLPGVTHTTDTELTPIATGSGRTETIDKGGHENETSSSSPETLTKEVRKTTVEYSHTTGQSTTSTLSTKQKTTAAEIDKSETSPEDSTDFVETSFATEPAEAETKDDSTQEEKSTTVSKTSLKPTKPTRIPTITTKDWEKTNITTRMEQTATEEALGGTATTRIRPSATETTKTKTEVQSTEEEKSSTSSILSTGLVILENATTIIASTKGEGETTPHTESTVFVGLPGVTHTTDTELTPIATGSGRTETIDKGGHENETSSSSPETLTKEVRKTTVEYSHTTGQSTTSTLSTKQKTTAAETDKSETSPEDSTDFVETSFATEPAEAETKDDSTQEEKSTTVSKTSLKPTKLTRTPTITTKDWEKTNITTRMEQTATEVALGGTATTSIKPSATETTKTKTGVQSTEEEKSSTTSILSAGQSTTSTLSTKQTTTAAETHKIETSPQTVTDFEETSFATEPAITETKVRSTQEEKSTTVSISSQKPTKLARTPATTSKDWENTNITTHLEQTATKEILGGTATARIRPSATKTTETGTEKVPATQLMTNIETNRLTTERTRTGPDVYSTTEESDISEKFMCQQNNFESQHCNKEGLFRFNGSCTLHYECYYSRTCGKIIPSEIYECPYCLKFNAKEMKCDLPENVPECTYHRLIKTAHCSTRRHKRHRCTGPGKFVVPENNQKYYDCIDTHINNQYHLIVKRCPRRHIFNDVTKECEKNEDCEKGFNCGRRRISQLASKCEGEHYAYDKYSCQKFYHCQHKKPKTPLCCPENYVFNVNFCQSQNTTLFCNWEELKKVLYKHNEDENKE